MKDLGLSATEYGFAAGLFFISYSFFEIPSNMALEKFGARIWIARIMATWGALAAAMAFVNSAWAIYVMRFLLGAAEAGFFPGVILYMSYWFPKNYRSRMIALFWIAVPISNGAGAAVSGWILGLHGVLGLVGWQWLFLVEGIPAIILSVFVLIILDDKPSDAKWLTNDERQWLSSTIEMERRQIPPGKPSIWSVFAQPQVLAITAIMFLLMIATYNMNFFLPQIFKSAGKSDVATGLLAGSTFVIAPFAMLASGWSSDRMNERKWHCVVAGFICSAGLFAAGFTSGGIALAGFILATGGSYAMRPPLWAMPSELLTGMYAAVGIAYINAVGNIAGFVGPAVMGWIKDTTGSYSLAVFFTAGAAAAATLVSLLCFPRPSKERLTKTIIESDVSGAVNKAV